MAGSLGSQSAGKGWSYNIFEQGLGRNSIGGGRGLQRQESLSRGQKVGTFWQLSAPIAGGGLGLGNFQRYHANGLVETYNSITKNPQKVTRLESEEDLSVFLGGQKPAHAKRPDLKNLYF